MQPRPVRTDSTVGAVMPSLSIGLAEDAMHFAQRQRNGLAVGGAGFPRGDAHVDEVAFDAAAVGEQDAADDGRCDGAALKSAPRSKRWLASVCSP